MKHISAQPKHTRDKASWLLLKMFCIIATILLIRCSSNDTIAGSGSQAGNGRITCVIYNKDGSPSSGAIVYLRSNDYTVNSKPGTISASSRNAQTDTHGMFSIDSIDTGNYCIEVNDGNSHAVLLKCEYTKKDTILQLPDDTLLSTSTIKGSFASIPDDSIDIYIQVYGLERVGIRDTATREFIINDIPQGSYTVRIMASSTNYKPLEVDSIITTPNETSELGIIDFVHQSQWQNTGKIYLNTSHTGADISGTVTDFPVLIRLNANSFNFNQAKPDGSDLRFTKINGTPLQYEIGKWDVSNKEAELWVKMDTVYGNDSTQFVNLYWGNSHAEAISLNSLVFDTTAGFQGVWHLEDYGKIFTSATENLYNGLGYGNQIRTTGVIGFGQLFDGTGDYIEMGDVCNPDTFSFTISAWIKKIGENKIQTIISKSPGGPASSTYGWLLQLDQDGSLQIFIATGEGSWSDSATFVLASNKWITDSSWHHVAAVINSSSSNDCRLYIDGSDVSTLPTGGNIVNIGRVVNSYPMRFGSDANGNCQWEGALDECRISFRAHSQDYIKLSYINQIPDDALIIYDLLNN